MTKAKRSLLLLFALLQACSPGPRSSSDAGAGGGSGGGAGGGNTNAGVCLDNDGDGVPGTGDCALEPLVDCLDADPKIWPGQPELCNGIDDNCDGQVDNNVVFQDYYPDTDGDGFGAATGTATNSCSAVSGQVTNKTDCDDTRATIKPTAIEVCNGIDDNCAGGVDNGLTFINYYPDIDADGFGAATGAVSACSPQQGMVISNTDCNDGSANIKPGATELCNNIDDNCSGAVDENNAGGGAACNSGQAGACAAGTQTCQSGALTCLRNVGPVPEKCDGLDNDCDNQVDEDFVNKGAACSVGLGVCVRSGVFICNSAQTGTTCSVSPGAPTAASCDGNDNDCDGVTDEPAFTNTVTLQNIAWSDIEVAPYYYSAAGCQGGVVGAGTDSLVGGGAVMAGGSSGLYFQQLSSTGAPVGTPKLVGTPTYVDVAIAQAGDGFMLAGTWLSSGEAVEIDFYYVDSTGTERAREWTEFRRTGTNVVDGLRLMRGNGKRVTAVWRESGLGILTARVEPFLTGTTWSILTPTQAVAPFTATTLVANASAMPGVGADSTHIDWNASVNCATTASLRTQAVAYIAPVTATDHSVRYFTMSEDGTGKSAETTLQERSNATHYLSEPEITHYRLGAALHWFIAFTETGLSPANEDLRYFMSSTYDGGATLPFDYAYQAYATANGNNSIARPRASATGAAAYLTALRYDINDAGTVSRQVMTRKILLATNTKDPNNTSVERSATTTVCVAGDANCRPGAKDALSVHAGWSTGVKVYYSHAGGTPGSDVSTLTCH